MSQIDPPQLSTEAQLSLDHHPNIPYPWRILNQSGLPPPHNFTAASSSSSSSSAASAFSRHRRRSSSVGSTTSPSSSLALPALSNSPSPTPPDMPYNTPFYAAKNFDEPRTPSPTMDSSPTGSPYSHSSRMSSVSESMGGSISPAPSVYSLTDSLREASFKQVHGRKINAHSDVYMLPADDDEIDRLESQHFMFKMLNGGNYLGPVRETLEGHGKQVLDMGTGTGVWAVEMAREFPEVQVVGVDLVPIQTQHEPPNNCRFEVDNVNNELSHFYHQFDVVHARHICAGITDYPALISETIKILRPRGLILFFEAEYYVFDANKRPLGLYPRQPDGPNTAVPALARFAAAFVGAVQRRGGKINVGAHLPKLLKQTGRFNEIVYQDVWFPATPWMTGNSPEARRMFQIGQLLREDLRSFLQAGRPMLLADGISELAVDELIHRSNQELDAADTPLWLRGCYTWARRAAFF